MCKRFMYLFSIVFVLAAGGVAVADPFQQDPGPDGIVSMEAENYDANVPGPDGDLWIRVGPTGGFTGIAGMQAPNGNGGHDTGYVANSERLDYQINFLKTGTHYVWMLAWGEGGSDDSCHVGLDGVATPLSDRMTGWSASYSWRRGRYERAEVAQIDITAAGVHVLNLYVREDGLIVDKIVLTTNPNYTLSGSEPGPPESSRSPVMNALNPIPADGALYEETWASLGWTPGTKAVSHDVYLGENFDDVNNGTAGTFRGNTPSAAFLVGLGMPGDPYPAGLVPGTKYYWRIDEIEASGTKHRGIVWSFFVPPRKAYAPNPADGAKYLNLDVKPSWSRGLAAKLHYVYFGDNLDQVSNATGAAGQIATSYTPSGPLANNKTYYWRVDEFDGATLHKGDVWSFRTVVNIPVTDPTLLGWWKFDTSDSTLLDWSGHGNHGAIVGNVQWVSTVFNLGLQFLGDYQGYVRLPPGLVTEAKGSILMWVNTNQTDDEGMLWYGTEINGNGYGGENEIHINIDDPGQVDFFLEEDGAGSDITINGPQVAGSGWTHVAATWDVTDGCRLYVNGVEVGKAAHNTNASNITTMRLGTAYSGDVYYEGMMDDVRLFDHAITAAQVSDIMNKGEDPLMAGSANPSSGARVPLNMALPLLWSAGKEAAQHDVYFGLGRDAVEFANASDTTGIYRGRQATTSYNPPEGVQFNGGPYYWRIDEINKDGTITTGAVWNFSVTDYLLVDDFESYNDIAAGKPGSNLVYATWLDGYGTTTNGSTIGYPTGASMETGIVYGGRQSVPVAYNNAAASSSEVSVDPAKLAIGRNWTVGSPQSLVLWFHGGPTNATTERMYAKINGVKVAYPGPAADIARVRWSQWNIDLAALGVNLANVTQFAIGFERSGATGGTGTVLIDEIRLYQTAPPIVLPAEEIWIEAEAATSITPPMKTYDDPLASGGKCIGTDIGLGNASAAPPPDGVATYSITVKGGVYKLTGRVIIPDGDSFWVRIQGATIPPTTELDPSGWVRWSDPPNGNQWHWEDVFSGDNQGTDDPTVLFTLPAGTHTLEIARREDGALLDVIVITKVN